MLPEVMVRMPEEGIQTGENLKPEKEARAGKPYQGIQIMEDREVDPTR